MALPRCFDAAFPPPIPPAGAAAVLGYIPAILNGVRYDRNFHSWSPAEWLPFARLRQFPVVELNPALDARASAQASVASMRALGWFPGRALVGAMETFIAPAWWAAFEDEVMDLGQVIICYGSESTVYQNHPSAVWEALYDGIPSLPNTTPPTTAKQYLSGGSLDWSVLATPLLDRGGEGPRKQ